MLEVKVVTTFEIWVWVPALQLYGTEEWMHLREEKTHLKNS